MAVWSAATLTRWLIPGAFTVIVGTGLAIYFNAANVERDLTASAATALGEAGLPWAGVSFEGRDGTVTGIATDPGQLDLAVEVVGAVPGVRVVTGQARLAPTASPYPFKAVRDAAGVTLSGGVPDADSHVALLALAGGADDQLELLSGVPDRDAWRAATEFALDQLARLDAGEVALSDLELSLAGRAASAPDYAALAAALAGALPEGVTLGRIELAPPLVAPYTFAAAWAAGTMTLSGHTPAEATAGLIAGGAPRGAAVVNGLELGSGAPSRFAEAAMTLVAQVALLQSGQAEISDTAISFAGQPMTRQIADAVTETVTSIEGYTVTISLAPPLVVPVVPYIWSATKSGGVIAFAGHVPIEEAKLVFALRARNPVSSDSSIAAPGAPSGFGSVALDGISALAWLRIGIVRFDGNSWSLSGRAADAMHRRIALASLRLDSPPPGGWTTSITFPEPAPAPEPAPEESSIVTVEPMPVPVAPYTWSATKSGGTIAFAGHVPIEAAKTVFALRARNPVSSDSSIAAPGAPADFGANAFDGIAALAWLRIGVVKFDGDSWSLSGRAADAMHRRIALASLRIEMPPLGGWTTSITFPEPEPEPAPAPEPVVAVEPTPVVPYIWTATKSGGTLAFAGHVPIEAAKTVFALRARNPVSSDSSIAAPGAPADFGWTALDGIAALQWLRIGIARYDGKSWSLSGRAANAMNRRLALHSLHLFSPPLGGWTTSITFPEPEPVAEPAPEVAPAIAPYVWSAVKSGGAIAFAGLVPTEGARRIFALRAGIVSADSAVVAPGAPDGFGLDALNGISALGSLKIGIARFDGEIWSLSGHAADEAARDAALASLAADPQPAPAWASSITVPVPAIDRCRAEVATFSSVNTILFDPASARIVAGSQAALERLALWLGACPQAEVQVEGHTDADGSDDYNLALALARSEAVVDRLIELGVNSDRLYAVGYGESLPIASNQTNDGKRRNRRIVFTIVEPGE